MCAGVSGLPKTVSHPRCPSWHPFLRCPPILLLPIQSSIYMARVTRQTSKTPNQFVPVMYHDKTDRRTNRLHVVMWQPFRTNWGFYQCFYSKIFNSHQYTIISFKYIAKQFEYRYLWFSNRKTRVNGFWALIYYAWMNFLVMCSKLRIFTEQLF